MFAFWPSDRRSFLRHVRESIRIAFALVLLSTAIGCTPGGPATSPDRRVQFSILEDYDKGEDLAEVARDFELFRELGVTTWRGSFGWDDYEPSRGVYDFEWLHRFADLAASAGVTLRPYIGYTPSWASAGGTDGEAWNDPPKDVEDWYRFVRALAAEMRRHRNIVSYEIYNEENVRLWWDGSPAAYSDVLRRGAEAIRAGNPDAEVLLGGMVFPDIEWLEALCGDGRIGRLLDVIPFHAYPETWTPPDVTVENYLGPTFDSGFARAADEACGPKPMWVNETGFATTPGRSELDQARWWARAVATFLAEPRIEHIGIYEIKDLPPERAVIGDAPNYHLGITRVDRGKKLAFGTLARLVSMFDGERISVGNARISVDAARPGGDVYRHLFVRADGRQFLFLWTNESHAVVDVQLPRGASEVGEYAIDGTKAGQLELVDRTLEDIVLRPGEVRFFEAAP